MDQLLEFSMKNRYRGYIWVTIVMIMPYIMGISSAPTPEDGIFFYVASIAVWGTVLSAILYAWDLFQCNGFNE